MSDDLVLRLRLGACALEIEQAADRIEELEAKLARANGKLEEFLYQLGVIYTEDDDLTSIWKDRVEPELVQRDIRDRRMASYIEELEAKLAKAAEALQLADAAMSGANMNMSIVERKVKASIADLKGGDA